MQITPKSLPSAGGKVTLVAKLAGAKTCRLDRAPTDRVHVTMSPPDVHCSSGRYKGALSLGSNGTTANQDPRFTLVVLDGRYQATRSFNIQLRARVSPVVKHPAGGSTTTTTAPLPPSGISPTTTTPLPPSGISTTTTTTVAPGGATTTTSTTSTPTAPTTSSPSQDQAPQSMNPEQVNSNNWSGYAVSSGPFTSVTGTFTVPSLAAGANASEQLSEWVGIDGLQDQDLIQAGVSEEVDPDNPSQVDVWPWWEILPAAATPINDLTVSVGDQVSVKIWQISSGYWGITLVDDNNGQQFTSEQAYSGPGQSAEWIVEAPENGQNGQIYPMAPYSPAVTFSDLGISSQETTLYEISLVQNGSTVSSPSGFSPTGFSVSSSGAEQ